MTIIQLEYLLAVANCGSFSVAAEHCFVTQPSLSMQIKALEDELGVVLLDRTKKPIIPSDEEMEINSRSKSAKLRVIEKLQEEIMANFRPIPKPVKPRQ